MYSWKIRMDFLFWLNSGLEEYLFLISVIPMPLSIGSISLRNSDGHSMEYGLIWMKCLTLHLETTMSVKSTIWTIMDNPWTEKEPNSSRNKNWTNSQCYHWTRHWLQAVSTYFNPILMDNQNYTIITYSTFMNNQPLSKL